MKTNRIFQRIFVTLLSLLLVLTPALSASAAETAATQAPTLAVYYLNVGQGDAAVIQCGGQTMMIDGGTADYSRYIYSWLQQHGITNIDYMIATHSDADHVGGLAAALNYATVGTAYCSTTVGDTRAFNSFVKYLAAQGKTITVPTAGTAFTLGTAVVQILGPISIHDGGNDSSIVTKVTFGNTSFLFTGDAEATEESELVASGFDLTSTVLKVGHHGSDTSTSYTFLRAVNPQYAVISVGAGNAYGHPTENTLSKLRDAGVATYRTDMQGAITAISNGMAVAFVPEMNATADTLAGAGAGQNSTSSVTSASVIGAATSNAIANVGTTYVLNTNSHKFHYASCKYAQQISAKNRQDVSWSRDQITAQGYKACKVCKP